MDSNQVKELRLEKVLPSYNLLGKWISTNLSGGLPKSPIGIAMRYTLERWDELGRYMYDGKLQIDNNNVENTIRAIAVGRKITCSPEAMKAYNALRSCILLWINASGITSIPNSG